MAGKKRKASSQEKSQKRRKLGKPKPQERLEVHSKQLRINEQNLRTAGPQDPHGKEKEQQKTAESELIDTDETRPVSSAEVTTYRRLTLNDIFNRMAHYSGKESAAGVDQLCEIIRRFPEEMKIHQFDISKHLIMCMTEHDDPYVRTASIRALSALFTMMRRFSFAGSGSGAMIEHVIMKMLVSCVCSIMSDMFVRMRAFGMDIMMLLIEHFPESMASHAYKLLPTLENVFLMTKAGIRHKGEDFSVIHDRAMNCLAHLTHILFQYGSKLQLEESDIHTHCHKVMNLKQIQRGKQKEFSVLERERALYEVENSSATADYLDTSMLYHFLSKGSKRSLNTFLETLYKRESDVNRMNAIDVTISNLYASDDAVPESVLYSLSSPYSLYRFCDRMFGTVKDKWVEAVQKGSNIQTVGQAAKIKTILRLMYGILYAIEHHQGVDYRKEIVIYLNDVVHHMVRCIPFSGTLNVDDNLSKNKNKPKQVTFGTPTIDNIDELNILLVAVLSFVCGWRLEKKKRIAKAEALVNWETLFLQYWEELVLSPQTTHSQFGVLIGAFHRIQYQIPETSRDKMWSALTTVFLKEKPLSVRQRLLLHYLSDSSLDDTLTIPSEQLVQWVDRIAKMLSFVPEKKVQLTGKLLLVVASFSMKPKFHNFLNTVILDSLPSFFYNFDMETSTFSKLSLDLQEKAINLLHYFTAIPLLLVRALARTCTTTYVPSRIITQIIEALRFKEDSVDLKAHITFLVSLLTVIVKRPIAERDEILHEILISISSMSPKAEEMANIVIPILSSLLERDDIDIDTFYMVLKVAFTVFDLADESHKRNSLWKSIIPELLADILCDGNTSSSLIENIYGLLEPNQDQFNFVLGSFVERLDEGMSSDVFIGFSRLMKNFDRFKTMLLSSTEQAHQICNSLKGSHESKNAVHEMESKLKLLTS